MELFAKERLFIKPTRNYKYIHRLEKFNDEFVNVKINYNLILDTLIRHKKNSVMIIVSDFFYEYDFRKLGAKYDTYAIIVRDRLEEDPSKLNGLAIIDPITNQSSIANFSNSYKSKILHQDARLFENFKKSNIRYMKFYTDDDVSNLRRLFG